MKSNTRFDRIGHGRLLVVLMLWAYGMLMFGNQIASLTHPDEVFYAQTAKEMAARNSWLTPLIFDHPQFEKPVLFYLLSAAAVKVFGMSPFVARFWPAFFGIVTALGVYWITWMLFGRRRQAFLAGFVLSTSFVHIALSRAMLTDMTFTAMVTLSLGCFYLAYSREASRGWGLIGWCVFSALAVLTKGLLGFSFTMTPPMLFLLYKRDFSVVRHPARWAAYLLFALVAVPWHVLMFQQYGATFIDEYWRNVHVRRIFESEHPKIDTWYFYFGVILGGLLPWTFFLVQTMHRVIDDIRRRVDGCEVLWFLLFWIGTVYLFTQPAHSKLASYILPMFPAWAMLLAYYFEQALQRAERRERVSGLVIGGYLVTIFLGVTIVAGWIAARMYLHVVQSLRPVYITSGVAVLTALAIARWNRSKAYQRVIFSCAGVSVGLMVLLLTARPAIEPWVSCKDVSDRLKKIDSSRTTVLASKFYVRGVRFYTDRPMAVIDIHGKPFWSPHPIPFLDTDQKVLAFLETQPVTYAVVKESNVEDLRRIAKGRYAIKEFGGRGGKYILRLTKINNQSR